MAVLAEARFQKGSGSCRYNCSSHTVWAHLLPQLLLTLHCCHSCQS